MKLSHVLVASNNNTHYLDFWPVVKEAWNKIVGLPCTMIYVGDFLPNHLKDDPDVKFFKAISSWPTATQAQCIRLLYPALIETDGAIMISDMDIVPLQSNFFIDGFEQFNPNQFVSLRGIDEHHKEIYMCYVGGTAPTWSRMFGIKTEDDVRARLMEWSQGNPSDGTHGGEGWCTDQQILYEIVKMQNQELVGLCPWTATIPRLCRSNPDEYMIPSQSLMMNLLTAKYVDFHMPEYHTYESIIYRTLEGTGRLDNLNLK
jgi:hypothetical protein